MRPSIPSMPWEDHSWWHMHTITLTLTSDSQCQQLKKGDTLEHHTSGDLIMLKHGVTLEDLRCSDELWQKSLLNPKVPQDGLLPPRTCVDLLTLHPETDHPGFPLPTAQLSRSH